MSIVNREISTPLYRQVAEKLRSDIEDGLYKEGDRIASEAQLCEEFGASRITIRQAIQELQNQGFLERSQGKGTFVARRRFVSRLLHLTSFSENMLADGLVPESRTIELSRLPADARIAQKLGINEKEEVLLVKRLRLSENIPLALVTSYFPSSLVGSVIDALASSYSVYHVLESLGIRVSRARQSIELSYATRAESMHLAIRPHTPIFLINAVVLDQSSRPIEYFKSVSRPDRLEFFVELERKEIQTNLSNVHDFDL